MPTIEKRAAPVQQYYRKLDKTMEWVESNYYHLPLEQQTAALITANAFWRDYAGHDPATKPFFSTISPSRRTTFPKCSLALSLVDLPFKAAEHKTEFKGTQMTLTAGSPMIVYHEEIQPAAKVAEHAPILVSENFFRSGDQFRQENGEQVDKFVTEEFLVDTVYGCHIVVTNPTSSKKKVEVLLQIPGRRAAGGRRPIHAQRPPRSRSLSHANARIRFYFPLARQVRPLPGASGQRTSEVLGVRRAVHVQRRQGTDQHRQAIVGLHLAIRLGGRRADVPQDRKHPACESRPHRLADARQGVFRESDRAARRAARVQHHALVVRREARRCAGHPPVLAVRRRVREPVRRLARQPAVDDRSDRAACLRADGLSPAGERPRRPIGPQARNPQRPLFCPIPASADDPQLPPAVGRRRADDGRFTICCCRIGWKRRWNSSAASNADQLATQLQYDYFAAYLDFYKVGAASWPGRSPRNMPTIRSIAGARRSPTSSTRPTRSASQAAKVADKEDRTQVQTARRPPRRRSISRSKPSR